jgi:hypothetical protein
MSQSKDEETKDEETKAAAAFIDGPLAEILGVKKRDVTCIGCGRTVPYMQSWKDQKAPDAFFCNARCAESYGESPKPPTADLTGESEPPPTEPEKVVDLSKWLDRNQPRASTKARMVSVDERRLEQLIRGRIMLAALVRPHGRVRIPARDLAAITQKCKLDVKVGENGDVVLSLIES